MFVLIREGSQLNCSPNDLNDACRLAVRGQAALLQDGLPVDCLAILGLDRPGLFAAPRIGLLRPTCLEVRAMIGLLGMSGADVARLTGTTRRKVRAWAAEENSAPWAAWHIMAVYVGLMESMRGAYLVC